MSREEEIKQAAKIFNASSDDYTVYKKGFESGAEWADKTLIEKTKNINLSTSGKLYSTWKGIRQRCTNPKATGYEYYGGKGIKVCEEWNSFFPFAIWAILNGYEECLTIDRIDTKGNYCPENCRWSDITTQANNTTRNHYIEGKTVAQYAEENNLNYRTLHNRVARGGMSIEDALSSLLYNPKKVYQYDMEGNFIAEYSSAKEAYKALFGVSKTNHIGDVCRGKRPSAYGFIWKYLKD